MKKSIKWRMRHAKRKIEEGKKVGKFTAMLAGYELMRAKEKREGVVFVHKGGVGQAWVYSK